MKIFNNIIFIILKLLDELENPIEIILREQSPYKFDNFDNIEKIEALTQTQINLDEYWYLRGFDPFNDDPLEMSYTYSNASETTIQQNFNEFKE